MAAVYPRAVRQVIGPRQAQRGGAGNRIRHIVVLARTMIDRVPATTRRAPLEAAELADQFLVVQQINPPAVDQRKQVHVEVALRLGRRFVTDAVFGKLLDRPLAGIPVTGDVAQPVVLQRGTVLSGLLERPWSESQ
jgi:hypothetical protein